MYSDKPNICIKDSNVWPVDECHPTPSQGADGACDIISSVCKMSGRINPWENFLMGTHMYYWRMTTSQKRKVDRCYNKFRSDSIASMRKFLTKAAELKGLGDAVNEKVTCTLTPNAAISGHNRVHLRGQTVESCAYNCHNAAWGCKSFDWYKHKGECDLSDKSAGDVGGLKRNYAGNPYNHYSCKVSGYQYRLLVADEGAHLGGIEPLVSVDQCATRCDSTSGCKSFAVCQSGPSGCWMKNKVVTGSSATSPNSHALNTRKCLTYFK